MEIVRTEPRDVAPVIPLPVRFAGNRVIEPVYVPPGTVLPRAAGDDVEEFDAGPLARALRAMARAENR